MTKAVIFDLNGVFVQSPKLSERFRDELGVSTEEFLPVLKEVMAKVRMPNAGSSYLSEIADKVYYSWQTGFVKPDKDAYLKVLTDNNLKPGECIYFDDSGENIGVASELGIKSYIFKNVTELEAELKKEFGLEKSESSEPHNL
ncbi:MAG: hypothetical protein A3I24_02055 [Candidatus Harrisonbacteria bacterium RIFCSPLOWO2_02_FULL_41_13b]|uniref:FCP1 homology domain-containing protein n=1 Tax=Candidatus Harrisonbacteria bacterium RIFCSPLOWO2_02_FULL_41_13b TaxID=1798409 RepID=A0A1G1ZTQ6_9BACT|nr:MAG: hypothetical protein A3I24_02055 [Candidatus Harrisonbacteria bacterium RIFCSPLOWO2_02_FULL_41_13b]